MKVNTYKIIKSLDSFRPLGANEDDILAHPLASKDTKIALINMVRKHKSCLERYRSSIQSLECEG